MVVGSGSGDGNPVKKSISVGGVRDVINYDLIVDVIALIDAQYEIDSDEKGAILVFLPGLLDITTLLGTLLFKLP